MNNTTIAQPSTFGLRNIALVSALLCSLVASTFQVAQAAQTKGRNVNVVEFGDNSSKLGTFRQIGRKQWVEQNKRGQQTFSFKETHRDEWSVYLHDTSRNVRLQLDLHRKMVGYSDSGTPMRDLYRVLSGSSKLSGWLARKVVYQNGGVKAGAFVKTSGKTWREIRLPNKQVAFTFQETHRDDWSIYLRDASRNVNIQLDLHTRKVMYSTGSSPRSPLYNIARAR